MAIISKEEIMERVNKLLGENTDDESISFLENITDSLNDYETKISESGDWKTKYEQNDAEWRKKYRERFMKPAEDGKHQEDFDNPDDDEESKAPTTFEELFKEKN